MSFDAAKSKLFPQIMAAAVKFFTLKDDATETEIHDALHSQEKTLAEQLEEAKQTGASEAVKDMQSIKDRLTKLETDAKDYETKMQVKDDRITELLEKVTEQEGEVGEAKKSVEALKTQHASEIKALAGQVSKLKAGRSLEQDEGGDKHEAEREETGGTEKVAEIKSKELEELVKKRQSN